LSLLVLCQAGCNGGSDSSNGGGNEPPPATSPAPTAVGTPDGQPTSANIGVAGGTVTTPDGKTRLTIPPGALGAVTTITLQPITNNAHGGLGKAYRLTPEGQTFAIPVQLTFSYTEEELQGSAAGAQGIAFQRSDGLWQWVKNPVVDTTAKTVTVQTTHFSDWSRVEGYQILPHEATVGVGETVSLKVVTCYLNVPQGELVVPLGYDCEGANPLLASADAWAVNGVPGGKPATGTIASAPGSNMATFAAPATKPNPATVAVSAELMDMLDDSPGKVLLVSHLTISESSGNYVGTVDYDKPLAQGKFQVTWKKIGEASGVGLYMPIGTVTGTTHVPGCTDKTFSFSIKSDDGISEQSYQMEVYPENHPTFPRQYVFSLEGQGNDVVLECLSGSQAMSADMLTKIDIGELHTSLCADTNPAYSDKATLAGNWTCPPFVSAASWTFAAQ